MDFMGFSYCVLEAWGSIADEDGQVDTYHIWPQQVADSGFQCFSEWDAKVRYHTFTVRTAD